MFRKRTLFLLPLASMILLLVTFTYFVILNSVNTSNNPYYKETSGNLYSDITVITQKQQWLKPVNNAQELLAKKKINETFLASTDNLGIIAIPFNTHYRSINDRIVFRVKQTGKSGWYFQSTYNANQLQNNIPFPFGFPVIDNSKNISYTFEIESLKGTSNDSLSINKTNYYFFTKYKFSKSELIKNPFKLVQFLTAKTIEQLPLLTTLEIIIILFSILFPLIIYLLFTYHKKIIRSILVSYNFTISSLKRPLDRGDKIKLCCLIICAGFYFSVIFHYINGLFLGLGYPFNTFLPTLVFGDFYSALDQWKVFKFTGTGFGLSYFPATFLIIDVLVKSFSRSNAIIVYLSFFTIFLFLYSYKYLRTDNKIESLQNALIISFMSYPFLLAFQTGNMEVITFTSLSLFFLFYTRRRLLSLVFLALAISTKAFPGVFIVLLFVEKRYKDIFLTFIFIILFTILPLIIFDGGFNKGIGNYLTRLKESQKMYVDLMVIGDAGNHYGHSLLNGLRTISPGLFPSIEAIMFPYEIFTLIAFLIISLYIRFFEKKFWKKVACLVIAMNLLPFTSTDYKLLYIYVPLFLLINHSKKEYYDFIFILLFSLVLIPKDYFYFNNNPLSTFNVVANPIIMLFILFLIILSGIKSSKYFLPTRDIKRIAKSL